MTLDLALCQTVPEPYLLKLEELFVAMRAAGPEALRRTHRALALRHFRFGQRRKAVSNSGG
jgi:hypothetical protein